MLMERPGGIVATTSDLPHAGSGERPAPGSSFIMILMCFALVKQFRVERRLTLDAEMRMRRDMFTAHVSQTLQEEGLIGGNGNQAQSPVPRRGLFGRIWQRD